MPDDRASDYAAFDAWTRVRSAELVRRLAPIVVLFVVVSWPIDFYVFPRSDTRIGVAIWRGGAIAITCALWIGMRASGWLRARSTDAIALATLVSVATSATIEARLGPGTRFLTALYLAPFSSMVVLTPSSRRAALVVLLAIDAYVAAYVNNPAVLGFTTWGAVLTMAAIAAFALGHGFHRLVRENFVQRLDLARAGKALEATNEGLEARVAERTNELRALAERSSNVLEDERARIAREVHDDLGQTLTAMRVELELATRAQGSSSSRESLEKLGDAIDRMLESTRRILGELRPQGIEELGLAQAIERLGADVAERNALSCEISIDPDFQADSKQETAIYRIVQEALHNVVKHARAHKVEVTLVDDDGVVRLLVRDDGRGLPERVRSGAMGIVGMRERATSIGGRVTIESRPNEGTLVELEIPRAKEREEAAS